MSRKLFILITGVLVLIGVYVFVNSFDSTDYTISADATIVAFGDSLTAGYGSTSNNDYVSVLSKMMGHPIVNLGIPGDTTANALERIDLVTKRNPELVIVFLGGNDVLRRVPIETTFENLDKIISTIKTGGSEVVLVAVPGSIFGDPYKNRFKDLEKKHDLILIPQFMSKLIGRKDVMFDSIHPNDAGYRIVAEEIYDVIKDLK